MDDVAEADDSTSSTTIIVIVIVVIFILLLLIFLFWFFFRNNNSTTNGSTGSQGPVGPQGPQGPAGPPGPPGTNPGNTDVQSYMFEGITPSTFPNSVEVPLNFDYNFNYAVSVYMAGNPRIIALPNGPNSENTIKFDVEDQGGHLFVNFYSGTPANMPIIINVTVFVQLLLTQAGSQQQTINRIRGTTLPVARQTTQTRGNHRRTNRSFY